jgi:hypothetical protein
MKRSGFRRANKFKAIKTLVDNIWFDSKLEASWYEWFKFMEKIGQIKEFEIQKEVTLKVNNQLICMHYPDYFYFDNTSKKYTFADAKGVETDVFKLKYKLTKALFPEFDYRICKGNPR